MALAKHSNILSVYPHIIERLESVVGKGYVREIGELAEMLNKERSTRTIAPTDGAVYVVFGGSTPNGDAGNKRFQREILYFTFVYCSYYLANGQSNLIKIGEKLTQIQVAFSGWDAGVEYVDTPFARIDSPAIEYNDGFAFYPISFSVAVSTQFNNN